MLATGLKRPNWLILSPVGRSSRLLVGKGAVAIHEAAIMLNRYRSGGRPRSRRTSSVCRLVSGLALRRPPD